MPMLLHPPRRGGPIRRNLTERRDESYSYHVSQNATIRGKCGHLRVD